MRKASLIKRSRAALRQEDVESFFVNWTRVAANVPPENIINYDETNLQDNPGAKKVLVRRGSKYPEEVRDHTKTAISVMFAGTASGTLLPPYVIYRAQNLYPAWCDNGPVGAVYIASQRGWIEMFSFTDWFKKVVMPYTRRLTGRKVLIGDNCSSHFSDEVFQLCRENAIEFVCLPANSTDKMQPLDVCFFSELKKNWRAQLKEYGDRDPAAKLLEKKEFPKMLKELLGSLRPEQLLPKAFEKCGLFPINSVKVTERIPSIVTTQEAATHIDQALLKKFDVRRFGESSRRKPRGKKIPAGQSYTAVAADLEEDETEDEETTDSSEESEDNVDDQLEEDEVEEEEDVGHEGDKARSAKMRKKAVATEKAGTAKKGARLEDKDKEENQEKDKCEEVPVESSLDGTKGNNTRPSGGMVVAIYQGLWYLAEVHEDQDGVDNAYTKLSYMQRVLNNCFIWGKEDILETVNSDILLTEVFIEPVNNRGHVRLRKNDLKAVESMMVVVYYRYFFVFL